MVINGSKSVWRPANVSVPQRSILKQILFKISINDADGGAQCTFSKFADSTKLEGVAEDPAEDCVAIQKDLGKVEK